jgi:hypothetical protein
MAGTGNIVGSIVGKIDAGATRHAGVSRISRYVDDSEIGAAHIVSPKGSIKKVKGVTQVRRGSARERLIAQMAKARTKGSKGGMR